MVTLGQYEAVKEAASDRSAVKGATHKFYSYPARFSPQFARAVMDEFTTEGDLVLDPFVGGGTTAVEALRSGRRCVGSDINELALFVSQTKCSILSDSELESLEEWLWKFEQSLKVTRSPNADQEWKSKGYFKHLDTDETWRNRNLLQAALRAIEELPSEKVIAFARCVVLRSAQLSLDGRKNVMSAGMLRQKIIENFIEMIGDMRGLSRELLGLTRYHEPKLLKANATELSSHRSEWSFETPRLILTSPPYPGVHVLYHRWQVKGRRETAAPYWIANKLDGDGERYYTLGNRHEKGLKTYFANIEAVFRSMAEVSGPNTIVVQMVAFSDPDWQLERYLEAMRQAGFVETSRDAKTLPSKVVAKDRIWRDVPNRKWHAQRQSKRASSKEVILFHRLA